MESQEIDPQTACSGAMEGEPPENMPADSLQWRVLPVQCVQATEWPVFRIIMYILDINQPFNIIYIGTIMFDLNINNNNCWLMQPALQG